MSAPSTAADRGTLAIVLHSHMPYVEGFGTWPFGEEWLWEALACVYLPLLDVLPHAPITLGLTPVLCDQLETLRDEAGTRFLDFLAEVRAPIHAEDARGLEAGGERELAAEVRRAATDYTKAAQRFRAIGGDVLGALGEIARTGPLELWTGPATHAVLPLLATEAGLRLQIENGVDSHRGRFGSWSGGFWLPECAYETGLENHLAAAGVSAFAVDQTEAFGLGSLDQLEPVATPAGPVALPLDWELIARVWDGSSSYPAESRFRDYHGRTVHDLKPWNNGGGHYRHYEALTVARRQAADFVGHVAARLDSYRKERARPGLCVFALDTELLGHWWYEGLYWLSFVIDEARRAGVALASLPEALERHPPVTRELVPASWGRPKDLSTWDSPRVAELPFEARAAELRTVAAAGRGAQSPALQRAARELLALQASDWAFQVTHQLAGDYPWERVRGHVHALDEALAALKDFAGGPEPAVRNLAPRLDISPLSGF